MKYAFVVAIMLAFAINLAPRGKAEQSAPNKTQAATQQTPPTIVIFNNSNSSPDQHDNGGNKQSPKWYESPEWVLVFIGLVTAGFIMWQAWETRRSVRAIRDSLPIQQKASEAALLNAQAVINSDRPWIYIIAGHSSSGAYSFYAGNDGNTPAEIVSYSCGFKCVGSINDLPLEPEYGPEIVPTIKLLVAKVKDLESALELMSFEEFARHFKSCGKTLDATQHSLMNDPKMSIFYFRVVYASPIKRSGADIPNYETRMCFYFSPSSKKPFSVCGNDNYNRHT